MNSINNRQPTKMEFTIASITEGIEYWLYEVVLKENVVVSKILWDSMNNTFLITIDKKSQVEQKP